MSYTRPIGDKIQAGLLGAATGATVGACGSFLHSGMRITRQTPQAAVFMVMACDKKVSS